ncbi:MAG TPA: M1 family aminopeptidase, partial [Vicinamibacterales bacterium]
MRAAILLALLWIWPAPALAAQQPTPPDGIDRLVSAIEQSIEAGDPLGLRALARFDTDLAQLAEFVNSMTSPAATAATVKERDRALLRSGRQRLMLEILTERGQEGRVSSWRVDVAPPESPAPTGPDAAWQIASIQRLSVVSGLYRLQLDPTTEFDVHDLNVEGIDLKLSLPAGRMFVARTSDGPTAIVLLGRGRVQFSPRLQAERVQLHIFCGQDAFNAEFDAAFLRLNPSEFNLRIHPDAVSPRTPHPADLRRATQIFETYVPLSFQIDLSDLSTQRWSLVPSPTDFVAEIATKRYGALTYARSSNDPEDVSFFDRRRHRNISVYESGTNEGTRRFFSEDAQLDYDITSYDLKTAFAPDRLWVDGRARLLLRTRNTVATMTLHLAEPLVVRSVISREFGRLLHLRVVGQNSILINFPTLVPPDTELELTIVYGGRLQPQAVDREAIGQQEGSPQVPREEIVMPTEPKYVYSNRSYWYPQSTVTDYATAVLTVVVPPEYDVVASGSLVGQPTTVDPLTPGQRPGKQYVFEATNPARYLACIISRFHGIESARLNLPSVDDGHTKGSSEGSTVADGGGRGTPTSGFNLFVQANPRQTGRSKGFADRAADILTFYTSILGDAPYNSLTVAITESDLPGGHSPAYFAILNQPLPSSPLVWRNDPVAFENYPSFFLAHEIAHQWWGQAVGWKNYHEQWLSEGFAQYFAALYAEHER